MIFRTISRLKTNFVNLLLFVKYAARRSNSKLAKCVHFNISDPRFERYLYGLLKMFDLAGWKVSLGFHPWLLLNLRNHADWIYDIPSLDIKYLITPEVDLLITDKAKKPGILLDTAYFAGSKPHRSINLPFFMNPSIYHTGLYEELPRIRTGHRHIKVFLGGNLDDSYDKSGVEQGFGIVNRTQIRRSLERHFEGSDFLVSASNREETLTILNGSKTVNLFVLKKNVVSAKEWMTILSSSSFFIAPPGTLMPFSHNIIEAMAMGAIPITQYGHLFDPPLEDGNTCLKFNDEKNLIEVVKQAVSTSDEQIARLSSNVLAYYKNHLDPGAVVAKIARSASSIDRLYIIAGHLSVRSN